MERNQEKLVYPNSSRDGVMWSVERRPGKTGSWVLPFVPWHLNVSHEQLVKAIGEVRTFCAWLEAVWRDY